MKGLKILTAFFITIFFLASGCATPLVVSSNIKDAVLMGIKSNTKEKIAFEYKTKIQDGEITPNAKDQEKGAAFLGSGFLAEKYSHTESATFGKMVTEYLNNKFLNIQSNALTKVVVSLEDFTLENYAAESAGQQVLTKLVLTSRTTNFVFSAKVRVLVTVIRNNKEFTKIITGTSEETEVSGGKGGRGFTPAQIHANNIYNANNKVLLLINSYFQELGL
ncbi:MAG: hypothetical protein AABY39_06235 [Nitrospirota bacterium]